MFSERTPKKEKTVRGYVLFFLLCVVVIVLVVSKDATQKNTSQKNSHNALSEVSPVDEEMQEQHNEGNVTETVPTIRAAVARTPYVQIKLI